MSRSLYSEEVISSSFQGICDVVLSMKRAIPVIHSPSGCSNYAVSEFVIAEKQGCHIFTSSLLATDVAHGGLDRLRRAVKEAVKNYNPELLVVTTTNVTELLISEDILQCEVEGLRCDVEVPVVPIYANTLRDTFYDGIDKALYVLTREFCDQKASGGGDGKQPSVNIIGPTKGIFNWRADLLETLRLLKGVDLRINAIVPANAGIEDFRNLPHADLTILMYPYDFGESAARFLEKEFGIAYYTEVPFGIEGTMEFLEGLKEYFPSISKRVEEFLAREMRVWGASVIDDMDISGFTIADSPVAVFGSNTLAYGLSRVLSDDLWMSLAVIGIKNGMHEALVGFFRERELGGTKVLVMPGKEQIVDSLKSASPFMVFGGFTEYLASQEAGIGSFIPASEPARYFSSRYLDAPFRGIRGVSYLLHRVWEETVKFVYAYKRSHPREDIRSEEGLMYEEEALKRLNGVLARVPHFIRSRVRFAIERILRERVRGRKVTVKDVEEAVLEAMRVGMK